MSGPKHSWNLTCPRDLLEKGARELERFREAHEAGDPTQVDHALNCAQTLWHIHDWVWKFLKPYWQSQGLQDQRTFREWLYPLCQDNCLRYCNDLADGSKHFILDRADTAGIRTDVSLSDVPDLLMERLAAEAIATGRAAVTSFALAGEVLKLLGKGLGCTLA